MKPPKTRTSTTKPIGPRVSGRDIRGAEGLLKGETAKGTQKNQNSRMQTGGGQTVCLPFLRRKEA